MFPTTPTQWAHFLGAMGVRAPTAAKFAAPFAEECRPELLRHGVDELDDLIAQTLHETGKLERLEENLYYHAARIRELGAMFPAGSRWARAAAQADDLEDKPEALAEVLYGGRFGNVNPGDGWKYRGRGFPQVTFHDNYKRLGDLMGLDLVADPSQLMQPRVAVRGLLLWWNDHIPDDAFNHEDRIRKIVSGGELGLDDTRRLAALARANLPAEDDIA